MMETLQLDNMDSIDISYGMLQLKGKPLSKINYEICLYFITYK